MLQAIAFYLFAAVAIASGVMVISARNPVHSVLFLILAFFNAAGLFVVMMLDINFVELRHGFMQYLPVGALIGIILLVELLLVFGAWAVSPGASAILAAPLPQPDQVTNTHALGAILYTRYVYAFQVAGVILLVAMIGAIVLTLRRREGVRRQVISRQVTRRREETLALVDVPVGAGIDIASGRAIEAPAAKQLPSGGA